MTTTIVRIYLNLTEISRYCDLVYTFNTYLQIHFTNFKLIVATLTGKSFFFFNVKKTITRWQSNSKNKFLRMQTLKLRTF